MLTRGLALHPGTRNRYTRTQHRPASRQVNDHGRVSGPHRDAARPDNGIQLANIFKYERRQDFSYIMMPGRDELQFFGSRDITAADGPWRMEIRGDELSMNSQLHISIIAVHKDNRAMRPLTQIDGLDPDGSARQTVSTGLVRKSQDR